MKKMTNRAIQAEKTKEDIYNAGIDLIRERGINEVNIADIVKKANVGIGTFYHHYESKMDLFMDLYRDADKMFRDEVREMVSGKKTEEAISIFFKEYCKLVARDGIEMIKKIFIPENHVFLSNPRPMYDLLLEIISEDQVDAKLCCDELFLVARGVVFDWALHNGSYNLEQKMQKMIFAFYK